MNINEATRQKLTDHLILKGNIVVDSVTTLKKGEWVIECGVCKFHNNLRVDALTPLIHGNENIVCKECKEQKKINKFLNRNSLTELDSVSDYYTTYYKLKCKDCNLAYNYFGNFQDHYKCYCKLGIKKDEHKLLNRIKYY
jgi:hypothetical protein